MMADGGFTVEGQENIQEILSKQLIDKHNRSSNTDSNIHLIQHIYLQNFDCGWKYQCIILSCTFIKIVAI